jgi:recombination protein RecR
MKYPTCLIQLIDVLKKLPGVGNKSAERYAFNLINWSEKELEEMGSTLKNVKAKLKNCTECGCLTESIPCSFCQNSQRDSQTICIVAYPKDVFAVEQTHEYKGLYHVLGGVLSPMEGKMIDPLSINKLKERISKLQTREVVVALDSTLEGDATALYLKQQLSGLPVQVSRLAFGLPIGSPLDFVDGGTLARAFSGRRNY